MEVRFLCDGMMGHLARWFRLLGFDAEYAGNVLSDDEILDHLARDPRVLVTRDVDLDRRARRKEFHTVLVPEGPLEDEVAHVLRAAGGRVEAARWFTRCTTCNGELVVKPLAAVRERVPEGVVDSTEGFRECDRCGQVYWEGTHVELIRRTFARIAHRLEAAT